MMVLDSSVLIDYLRGETTPGAERLAQIEEEQTPFAVPLVCFQEILQGARDEKEWNLLEEYLGTQRLLAPSDPRKVHREAARIFFDARRRGLTIRSTVDCLIAALVLEAGAILLHDDSDFESIARIRPLKQSRG
jgi:predicted nucleic acid-binding protein